MHSFRLSYSIFVLLILMQNFAYVQIVAHEKMASAKVFTNFLKVPWINLNSSWADEVAPICGNDIATLFESADAGEMWAMRMLDAASKIPSGILTGNIRDLGMYDECIGSKVYNELANIQGRHCMVSLSMPVKFVEDARAILNVQKLSFSNPSSDVAFSLTTSVCLPSSCGIEDVLSVVNASIRGTPELIEFEVRVVQVKCSSVDIPYNFTLGTILAVSFIALIVILLIFCTACDFVVRTRSDNPSRTFNILAQFSLHTNASKLLCSEINPGTMPAINGIRFLSMCFILVIHRILNTMVKPLVNLSEFYEFRESWLAPFILMLPYAVDTFFMISGFFTAYLFLKSLSSGKKFNILELYLGRYLRLTPCVAVLILFDIFILPHLGSGPIWETIFGVSSTFCSRNWWTNLLYVQNFVNRQEMCMPHTWYLAVEMQLFWLCPIILYPLFHRPKVGLAILSMFLIVSLIIPVVQIFVNEYSVFINVNKTFAEGHDEFFNFYTITYNRALPYFVGVLLGYHTVNKKRELTKTRAAFNWILSCVFILFCFWNTSFIQPYAIVYSASWEVVYASVGRLAWSLAIAWILYACTHGYGGPVTRFLSLPVFIPLTRLSYGMYLVAPAIQVGINSMVRTAEFHSSLSIIYAVCGDLAMSSAAAFVLSLCFESPVIVLEKILRAKRPSSIT